MTNPLLGRGRGSFSSAGLGRAVLGTPGIVLLALFAVAPMIALIVSSVSADGGGFTLDNLVKVFASPTYLTLLGRTILVALLVTVLSIAIGWPAAWALARYTPARFRLLILSLAIIPYITSQILLIYGMITLLQPGGPLMSLTTALGFTAPEDSILYTPAATIVMLVYESLPTAILVMYAASDQLDGRLIEAARSLGVGTVGVFRRVIWPLSAPLLFVNFALTFVQTAGAFAEPSILGGPNGQLIGNVIAAQVGSGVNRGFAVALSLVLLVVSLAIVGLVSLLLNPPKRPGPVRLKKGSR